MWGARQLSPPTPINLPCASRHETRDPVGGEVLESQKIILAQRTRARRSKSAERTRVDYVVHAVESPAEGL